MYSILPRRGGSKRDKDEREPALPCESHDNDTGVEGMWEYNGRKARRYGEGTDLWWCGRDGASRGGGARV
jgi:hypothetical protein